MTPPWNFPCAIPAGGCLAALMTGNAVILKPAPETRHLSLISEPVLANGRLELRHYFREQSISQITHRYGNVDEQARPETSDSSGS